MRSSKHLEGYTQNRKSEVTKGIKKGVSLYFETEVLWPSSGFFFYDKRVEQLAKKKRLMKISRVGKGILVVLKKEKAEDFVENYKTLREDLGRLYKNN